MKRYLLSAAMLLFAAGIVFSVDFGLMLDQKIELENKNFTYTPGFGPWFSWNGGQGLSVYLSGLLSVRIINSNDGNSGNDGIRRPALLPELGLFSLMYRSSKGISVDAGRILFSDTSGLTASGLFDGANVQIPISKGSLSAGMFYTGLLYKETAKIVMSSGDELDYNKPWKDFGDYGASRRLFFNFRWSMPVFEYSVFSADALMQFDCNGNKDALHSQFAELNLELYPAGKYGLNFGFLFEAVEHGGGGFDAAFGGLAAFDTVMPGSLNDGLVLTLKLCSKDFKPLTSPAQGMVFSNAFSGLAVFSADYNVRILPSLFAEGIISYFMRTYSDKTQDGIMYGGEFWASLAWQPFDDLRFVFGGGIFIPGMGNAYPSGTDPMWKINIGLSLSL